MLVEGRVDKHFIVCSFMAMAAFWKRTCKNTVQQASGLSLQIVSQYVGVRQDYGWG